MDTQKKVSIKPARRNNSSKKRVNMLPAPEMYAILRAADEIIGEGGRTQLAKILKGSKEKQLLERGLDGNPSYGFYRDLTLEQIMEKVDILIDTDFIRTELYGKLPLIEFTPRGWAVERERRVQEFLQEWDHWLENGVTPVSMEYLKERNRGMIFLLLFRILCSGDKKYIPYLRQWEKTDFKKVQAEIRQIIDDLNRREQLDVMEWQQLLLKRSKSLIIRSNDPIFLACQKCGGPFIFDEHDLSCYQGEGLRFQEICPRCQYDEEEHLIE
ncbi:RQC domain protein [compost metagenome]